MRKPTPVNLIVYRPRTEREQIELARRTADIHAETVLRHIQNLHVPHGRNRSCWIRLSRIQKNIRPVDKFQINMHRLFPTQQNRPTA